MNYKMMGKFISRILLVEAVFMVPALLISNYFGAGRYHDVVVRQFAEGFLCKGGSCVRGNQLDCYESFGLSAVFYLRRDSGLYGCAV